MNMFHPTTTHAAHADLFADLQHLMAQLDSPATRRTARLTQSSRAKKARKLVEESVDLLYHLAVLWHDAGIACDDVRAEMCRRMGVLGIAEKLPKQGPAKKALKREVQVPAQPCALYRQGDQIGRVTLSNALA